MERFTICPGDIDLSWAARIAAFTINRPGPA